MASRNLGSLTIDLIAKVAGFEQGMDRAARVADKRMKDIEARAKRFGAVFGTAIVAGLGIATNEIRNAINRMDDLSKAAQRVSLPTEQFSELVYAGKLADVEIGTLQTSLGRLTKAQSDSLKTTSEQAKVFNALGISATDAEGNLRSSYDVLLDFADAFKRQEGSPEIVAAGLKIFGRNFQELIPLIKDGSQGLRDAADEAASFGQIISTETGREAEAFNDNLSRMKMLVSGLANSVAAELLPDLKNLTDEWVRSAKEGDKLNSTAKDIADAIRSVVNWMREGSQVGASFRRTLEEINTFAGANLAILPRLFQGDFSGAAQASKDAFQAGGRIWDAAWNGVEEAKRNRPITIIESSDLKQEEEARVRQMRLAAAEAKRLRELAFGDTPKTGSRGRASGKSEEQRELESLQRSYESLTATMKERIALFNAPDTEEARLQYKLENGELSNLDATLKENLLTLARQEDAQKRLREEGEARMRMAAEETDRIQRGLEVGKEVLDDLRFELELMKMTNAERATAIQLRGLEAEAVARYGDEIADLNQKIEQAMRVEAYWYDLQRDMSDAFYDFATGAKSAKDALGDFLDAIYSSSIKAAADYFSETIANMFKGAASGNSQGGGWGDLFSWLGGMFGGNRESGGPVYPDRMYRINEAGMEMLTVQGRDYLLTGGRSGKITPAGQFGAGGVSIQQTNYFDRNNSQATPEQISVRTGQAIQRQLARTGR